MFVLQGDVPDNMKRISICLSTTSTPLYTMLKAETGAEIIYGKKYGDGVLYALIHTAPRKKHSTMDKCICKVDASLQNAHKIPGKTFFKSISPLFSGKVCTFSGFDAGQDKNVDEHYRAIFNVAKNGGAIGRKHYIWPDVEQYPRIQTQQTTLAQEQAEIRVNELAYQENPSAYGSLPPSDDSMDGVEYQGDPGAGPSCGPAELPVTCGEVIKAAATTVDEVLKDPTPTVDEVVVMYEMRLSAVEFERDEAQTALGAMTAKFDGVKVELREMTVKFNRANMQAEAAMVKFNGILMELGLVARERGECKSALVVMTKERDAAIKKLDEYARGGNAVLEEAIEQKVLAKYRPERDEMMKNLSEMRRKNDDFQHYMSCLGLVKGNSIEKTLQDLSTKLGAAEQEVTKKTKRIESLETSCNHYESCMNRQTKLKDYYEGELLKKHEKFDANDHAIAG